MAELQLLFRTADWQLEKSAVGGKREESSIVQMGRSRPKISIFIEEPALRGNKGG